MKISKLKAHFFGLFALVLFFQAMPIHAQDVVAANKKCLDFGFQQKTKDYDECVKQVLQSFGAAKPSLKAATTQATSTSQLDEKFWDGAVAAGNREAFQAYLNSFPKGQYVELARANLVRLNNAADQQRLAGEAFERERLAKEAAQRQAADEAQKRAELEASIERDRAVKAALDRSKSVSGSQPPSITVAYISNGNTNEGWALINSGARAAGVKPGVKFIDMSAERGELSKQIAIVEDMISRRVNAIAIAPVDSAGISPVINKALAAGIKVVAVDTGITAARITSYVATDNIKAAMVQGKWTAEQINDGDTVIYVTGDLGQSTGQERRRGFIEGLKALRPYVKIVEVPTTWDQTMAKNGVQNAMLANPTAKVIACAWDGGSLGAKTALLSMGRRPNDVKIAGFDGSPGGLDMMKQGWQSANAAQMLSKIGQVGVETAIAAAEGKQVYPRIDTGSFLVLPSNVDQFARDSGVGQYMRVK